MKGQLKNTRHAKKSYRKAKGSVSKAVKEYVKHKIDQNIEDKYLSSNATYTIDYDSPQIVGVNLIDCGSASEQRVGLQATMKYIDINIAIYPHDSSNVTVGDPVAPPYNSDLVQDANFGWMQINHYRWVLVRDKKPNGSPMGISDLFQPDGGGIFTPICLLQRALGAMNKFDIIYDSGVLKSSPPSEYVAANVLMNHTISLKNIKTLYSNDSGSTTASNIEVNGLYFMMFTDANPNHQMDTSVNLQLCFQDA